ncbi:MAG: TatD family hydrolase [Candidatus Nomurabacteria bacterium]|nr:TatD family hydrolase [Candidatus Nomurabacteria bacterium]
MTKYIDIHSHLNLEPLKSDHEGVIARMVENNVSTITIGVDYETSKEAITIAEKYDFIWVGVGLHPTDNTSEDFDISKYETLAQNSKVVCIGECGLDYFRGADETTKEKQKEIFKSHIELAIKVGKPLMIHARPSKGNMDAYEDALDILENYKKENNFLSGNFHFFVGDVTIATRALAIGFTMSFDGPITFTTDYDEVIKLIPIESIMTETDSPFAAPVPYRGKTCEPYMVKEVVKKIALLKNMTENEVAMATFENAKRIFGIQ